MAERARIEAEAVIRELNRPVPLAELYEKIAAKGVRFNGKKPAARLSAILGAVPHLVTTNQGWWIADAIPQAQRAELHILRQRRTVGVPGTTYPALALRALTEAGRPLASAEMIEFIRQHRELPEPTERSTIVNITSAFSHEKNLKNIWWGGGRKWWFADREPPDDSVVGTNGHAAHQEHEGLDLK
jgi:hypothetical protein